MKSSSLTPSQATTHNHKLNMHNQQHANTKEHVLFNITIIFHSLKKIQSKQMQEL